MKKYCLIILAACLMLTLLAIPAGAEAGEETEQPTAQVLDLSVYGDEELVNLLRQVQTEVADRGIEKTASIPAGTFVFGEDIPIGKYLLKKEQGDTAGMIELAAATDPAGEYPSKMYEFVSEDVFETYITAEEGDRLTVEFPCTLTICAGIRFQ